MHAAWREAMRDPAMAAIALIVLTGTGVVVDILDDADANVVPMVLLIALASFGLQYALIRRTMRRGGLLATAAPGAIAAFFGLLFVSSIAITLGFVLLILPGLWLYARWIAAVPILFAHRDRGVIEAMDESTRRSRALMPRLFLIAVLIHLPVGIGLLVSELVYNDVQPDIALTVLLRIADSGSQILGWYLAVAVYRATQPEPLDAVFA
ncbi:hypothetical protein ASE78_12975 [Sphingomonas sp. Leaf25]|nr:hypothetical protein ASE78_12975 [Sphingomonas sp. Leaf25]